jgi:hypothetical protein
MPAFSLNIIAGQLVLSTLLGAPVFGLIAIAAFIAAAVPVFVRTRSWLTLAAGLLASMAIILATPLQSLWALPFGGVLVGLCIRATERYHRLWFPVAIGLALCIAGTAFAFGHYGQDNCYP